MENPKTVDQLLHPALDLIACNPKIFTRQGTVVATWRRRGDKIFGPYYRLAYRQAGRQCSIYLGRAGALVQRVRSSLAALHGRLRDCRFAQQIRLQIRGSLRAQKTRLATFLKPLGLRLQGFEVRGWRASSLRRFIPHRLQPMPSVPIPQLPKPPRIPTIASLFPPHPNGMCGPELLASQWSTESTGGTLCSGRNYEQRRGMILPTPPEKYDASSLF
jgi:hypothetical protein